MILFLILSFLEILAERRQKSISVEFNLASTAALQFDIGLSKARGRKTLIKNNLVHQVGG